MDKQAFGRGGDYPGRLTERWPREADGAPVRAVLLERRSETDMDAALLVNLLEAYGVPCLVNYPGAGQFGKVVLGMSGYGADIYVPETMLDEAAALAAGGAEILEGEENGEL